MRSVLFVAISEQVVKWTFNFVYVMCFVDHEALVSLPTPVHIWWMTPKMLVLIEWMEEL